MKKTTHILLMLFTGLALLRSCSSEPLVKEPDLGKKLSLQLIVSLPEDSKTRAAETALNARENQIDEIEVLFFNGEECVWHPLNVTYDTATNIVTVPKPVDQSLFDGATQYAIYVIANHPILADMTGNSLTALKNILLSNSFVNNGKASPPPFVMEGFTLQTITQTDLNLGTVMLQRVLSKIRICIKTGDFISPYMNGAYPAVALQNYKTEATLIDTGILPANLPLKYDGYIAADSSIADMGLTTDYPFYTCPNNWSADPEKETFIMVKIPQTVGGVTTDHYYKVNFNYLYEVGSAVMVRNNGLDRNHYYDIELFINQPGGSEEAPLTITGNHTIMNWTTKEVYGSITSEIFLSLSEQTIFMDDVSYYTIRYSSSTATVTIKDINPAGAEAPVVTVTPTDATSGTITIYSAVPTNFQPKNITFTVTTTTTTTAGLDVRVEVLQIPAITIALQTATKSSVNLEPDAALSKNIYLITSAITTAATNRIVGFPLLDANGYTTNSEETSRMISPVLMVASGIGNNSVMTYGAAQAYCSGYWETSSAGVTYNDWRLPTLEELKLIDQLQDSNVIDPAMTALYYWDARSSDGPFNMTTGGTNNSGITTAAVRCVRDVRY